MVGGRLAKAKVIVLWGIQDRIGNAVMKEVFLLYSSPRPET